MAELKSDRIRRLLAEGKSRSQVARIVGCAYQQVYQIDIKRQGGSGGTYTGGNRGSIPQVRRGSDPIRPRYRRLDVGFNVRFGARLQEGVDVSSRGHKVRTGPNQDRIAVHDGHEVRSYEGVGGTECEACHEPTQFSARDQAYVHRFSGTPVTRIIQLQTGPGLFD